MSTKTKVLQNFSFRDPACCFSLTYSPMTCTHVTYPHLVSPLPHPPLSQKNAWFVIHCIIDGKHFISTFQFSYVLLDEEESRDLYILAAVDRPSLGPYASKSPFFQTAWREWWGWREKSKTFRGHDEMQNYHVHAWCTDRRRSGEEEEMVHHGQERRRINDLKV